MYRQPRENQPLVILVVASVAAVIVVLVLALTLSGGGRSMADDRSTPDRVMERVTAGLQANKPDLIWNEMSPELQDLFPLESWRQSAREAEAELGRVMEVRVISLPQIRTEAGWDGQWAEAEIEIVRQRMTNRYVVRFILQDGQWWLFGTLDAQ